MAEAVEPLTLKGKSQTVQALRLVSMRAAPQRSHTSRFVGRERDMVVLDDALERALAGSACGKR